MADVFDNENDQTITINEYLDKVAAEELEADMVLGGDEGKECTYNLGYMKRQAIFSCLTCVPDGNAGVCTACSLSCHDGHEVFYGDFHGSHGQKIVELWTKRNFQCDCGNSKFGESFCKLFPSKDVENAENSYNHNFKGLYCTCGRPYPDPNAQEQEEMIQCIMCEDWYHEEHLGLESSNEIPRDKEGEPLYEDFICKGCSGICSFLTLYPPIIWATGEQTSDATVNTNKDKDVLEDLSSCESGKLENNIGSHGSSGKDNPTAADGESGSAGKQLSINGESSEKNIYLKHCTGDSKIYTTCIIGVDVALAESTFESKPLFLFKSWRDNLCRCEKCLYMYDQKRISYLLDKEDSIAEYENMAKEKREEKLQEQEGAELNFFSKLCHVEKMEILSGIADFKDEFHSFLESFDTSKTITSSDVKQIFENLAKKRRRLQ